MPMPLDDVCLARFPKAALPALARLRCHKGVTVAVDGDWAWLRWTAGDEQVMAQVLPLNDVELFLKVGDRWYRPGQRLPVFDLVPPEIGKPLEGVLFPATVQPEATRPRTLSPITLSLARDDRPRPTTGWLGPVTSLRHWTDRATTAELEAVQGASAGERVLLLGRALPLLDGGQRLWGRWVLVPLGWRPEPALDEELLRSAFSVASDELLLLDHDGVEVVSWDALRPLSRASVRLALAEVP